MATAEDREREPKPQPGDETPEKAPDTPAAADVNRQDKQKDKPDSGQNEDG